MFQFKDDFSRSTSRLFSAPEAKVLVVDDNMINREIALGMLEPYDLQLSEADSGVAAIDKVKETDFDIIFMDHMMPEMDGIEAARIIREHYSKNDTTPAIVALTANAMSDKKNMFLLNGFQDFLSKPVDRTSLHEILTRWIAPEKILWPETTRYSAAESVSPEDLAEISMKGIDIEAAMKNHTGTIEHYLKLIHLFYMDGLEKCRLITELCETGDYANYRIEVHALKSASANLGALELSAKAKDLELAVLREDVEYINTHTSALLFTYEELLGEMKNILEKKGLLACQNTDCQKESIPMEALLQGLTDALTSLEDFHAKECKVQIDRLLSCKLDPAIENALTKVQTKLLMYADDDAENLLRNILSNIRQRQNLTK